MGLMALRESGVDGAPQVVVRRRGEGNLLSVHKNDGCPVNAQGSPPGLVSADAARDFLSCHIALEASHVETQVTSVSREVTARIERANPDRSVRIKRVMHLPKLALQTGRFRGARCRESIAMVRKRMLPESKGNFVAVIGFQIFQDGPQHEARKTFEIAKFFQCNRRASVPVKVWRFRPGNAGRRYGQRSMTMLKKEKTDAGGDNKDAKDNCKRQITFHVTRKIRRANFDCSWLLFQ